MAAECGNAKFNIAKLNKLHKKWDIFFASKY